MGSTRHDLVRMLIAASSGRGEPASHTKATEPSPVTEMLCPLGLNAAS